MRVVPINRRRKDRVISPTSLADLADEASHYHKNWVATAKLRTYLTRSFASTLAEKTLEDSGVIDSMDVQTDLRW